MNIKYLKFILGTAMLLSGIFSVRAQTPGGANNTTFSAWLTPDSYNNGVWTNLIPTGVGNFISAQIAPVKNSLGGYNFHPVISFDKTGDNGLGSGQAPNRLYSEKAINITSTDNVTIIFVFQKKTTDNYRDYMIGFSNNENYAAMSYRSTNGNLTYTWPGTTRDIGFATSGILTIDNSNADANVAAEGIRVYKNGIKTTYASAQWNGTSNNSVSNGRRVVLGGSTNTNSSGYGYRGNLQEVILIKNPGNGHVNNIDLQKIHSYLAIKYGITLVNNDNYINSDGISVWNRDVNYNSNIFGIGRDNAAGLNQVQSRSIETEMITLFKGNKLETLNDKNSNTLSDKTFLMLGSNGFAESVNYIYPAGTIFAGNVSSTEKINTHAATYKAQITTEGILGGTQTVGIKVISTSAKYVLVSDGSGFLPSNTRIYPIVNQIATNVVINNGEYITIAGYERKPGGVNLSANGYTLDLWVDGNHSTNTSWNNVELSNFKLEKFASYAPIVRNSKFNFHNELYFGNNDISKLRTSAPYNLNINEGYYIFVVSDATKGLRNNYSTLLSFNNSYNSSSLLWNTNSNTSNVLFSYWPGTQRSPNFAAVANQKYGITTLNVSNTNNGMLYQYLNGTRSSLFSLTGGSASTTVPLLVGSASNNPTEAGNYPFNGSIQEIILIRKKTVSGTSDIMSDLNIAKIHSYLAVKYGITLSDSYLNSNGDTIWNRSANASYNKDIFGIGRDDDSGLYQKQAHNANKSNFVVFIDKLKTLNSQNQGTLDNMQYLMIGGSEVNSKPISETNQIHHNDQYENGRINAQTYGINIQGAIFKAQITGPSQSMKVKMSAPSEDFTYALISSRADFDPLFTKIYSVDDNLIAEVDLGLDNGRNYVYIRFIGYTPGPGGINNALALWLRADDPTAIEIENSTMGAGRLADCYLNVQDPNNVPGVSEWNDFIREQYYTFATGAADNNHRIAVMEYNSREMNYHPAVHFWSNGNYAAYLSNAKGILPTATRTHTAIFLVNNDFSTNDWVYNMGFSPQVRLSTDVPSPAYGVYKSNNNIVGRFPDYRYEGDQNLFTVGSTTISSYYVSEGTSNANKKVKYRFNGAEDSNSFTTTTDLSQASIIGTAYRANRTIQGFMSEVIIYDGILSDADRRKVESYLALKYGITVRPGLAGSTLGRFNYEFSDNKSIWPGENTSGKFVDFYNNIGAVIRDNAARQNNRHAISTESGSLLHLGVAGTTLSDDGSGVGSLQNMEAVAFGNTSATSVTEIQDENPCGKFSFRFDRIWLIHKITNDNRPIRMLVGAQDNSLLTIGNNDEVKANYYSVLRGNHDVYLIVADSPEDITAGAYKAVIPMNRINKEYQCSYEFTEEDTYITFGYKENRTGCVGNEDAVFSGIKTFNWTQWTSQINTSSATGFNCILYPGEQFGNLGDNIKVEETSVSYPSGTFPSGVRAIRGYPRSVNSPFKGSLEVRRRGGYIGEKGEAIINIKFNYPVIPEFSISGLDSNGNAYEEVEITGECNDGAFAPTLSYASAPKVATYKINGNRVTVFKRSTAGATRINGRLNVAFNGGVTSITIKYRVTNKTTTASQRIFISPITLRSVPPPPPVNEDGLSFVKQVDKRNFLTCEPVRYSFEIQNTNCAPKKVAFSDSLPEYMKWQEESFGLDSESDLLNPDFDPQIERDGQKLVIDSLVIPGSSVLTLSAMVLFDEDAPSGAYCNKAAIGYKQIIRNNEFDRLFYSLDKETLDSLTTIIATHSKRHHKVEMTDTYSKQQYKENDEIEVTYMINNPNAIPIMDAFLEINFNEEFTYISNSLQIEWIEGEEYNPAPVLVAGLDPGTLIIAGATDGSTGFTLPTSKLKIKFKLKAPLASGLIDDLDENDQPTGNKVDLGIMYSVYSNMEDQCLLEAIADLNGEHSIPYKVSKSYIISNKNVTTRIKR